MWQPKVNRKINILLFKTFLISLHDLPISELHETPHSNTDTHSEGCNINTLQTTNESFPFNRVSHCKMHNLTKLDTSSYRFHIFRNLLWPLENNTVVQHKHIKNPTTFSQELTWRETRERKRKADRQSCKTNFILHTEVIVLIMFKAKLLSQACIIVVPC